ncbi:hypothetical protein N7486_010399 [Penicillium sp. IBT 16267x]|nr:hypothetical protein N7486_010399 [Penicillium sp. IBT 16267x]
MASAWTQTPPWIWLPAHSEDESQPGRYFLFRKSFQWTRPYELREFPVHVSADSRYRLFVNGQRVSFGPCKSYPERWYYETIDILPYLTEGENVISAPARPGFKRLRIEPRMDLLTTEECTFVTPTAKIKLKWTEDGNLEVELSTDIEAEVVFGGSVYIVQFVAGKTVSFLKETESMVII